MGRRNSIYDQFVPVMARHFIWNRQKFPDIFLQVIENEELAVFSNNFQTWSYKEKNLDFQFRWFQQKIIKMDAIFMSLKLCLTI